MKGIEWSSYSKRLLSQITRSGVNIQPDGWSSLSLILWNHLARIFFVIERDTSCDLKSTSNRIRKRPRRDLYSVQLTLTTHIINTQKHQHIGDHFKPSGPRDSAHTVEIKQCGLAWRGRNDRRKGYHCARVLAQKSTGNPGEEVIQTQGECWKLQLNGERSMRRKEVVLIRGLNTKYGRW